MLKNPKRWHRTLGLYIFFAGVLLGMLFAALLTWADFEANLFDRPTDLKASGLGSLRCPVLLNRQETGTVTATFSNPTDYAARRTIDASISHGFIILMREERTRIDLEPGEKRTLEWPISPEDAAWGRFILVHVETLRSGSLPARSGSCGVLVANLPFGTGTQITIFIVVASLLLMVIGAILWRRGAKAQRKGLRTVDYLALALGPFTLLTLITSIIGIWLVSLVLLVLSVLTVITIVTWVLN
ncbi:MAG: hypothetical protein JXR84_08075 [Anaerolineae bacterium]|nr:hypothetical protein [Anaerolineae bacterium]